MISVFRAAPMRWTFFESDDAPEELKRIGMRYVETPAEADIIIADRASNLQKFGAWQKRFVIWTPEPRIDLHHVPLATVRGISRPVHVMNVYTGRLYRDNYLFLASGNQPYRDRDAFMRAFASKPHAAVILATFQQGHRWFRWYVKEPRWRQDARTSLVGLRNGALMRD